MLNNTLYDIDGKIIWVALIPPDLLYAPRAKQFRYAVESAMQNGVDLSLLQLNGADYEPKDLEDIGFYEYRYLACQKKSAPKC